MCGSTISLLAQRCSTSLPTSAIAPSAPLSPRVSSGFLCWMPKREGIMSENVPLFIDGLHMRLRVNHEAPSVRRLCIASWALCIRDSRAATRAPGCRTRRREGGDGSSDSICPLNHDETLAPYEQLSHPYWTADPVGGITWRATLHENATWLILPVVICLSQRLSHACVSMN